MIEFKGEANQFAQERIAEPLEEAKQFAPGRIVVKFKKGIKSGASASLHRKRKTKCLKSIEKIGVEVIGVPAGKEQDFLDAYKAENGVEYAELDHVYKACLIPNDPRLGDQWGATRINVQDAWDVGKGDASIKIAILDTGIDQDHEDLASKIVANYNATTTESVDDLAGHGTHCAGTAAAITNNGVGVAGIGYNCSLMNVKVLNDSGGGLCTWIADGITWAADNGAHVISLSLGGYEYCEAVEDAVNYAWAAGAVVVAAAGNDGYNLPFYPAYYTNSIAVGAIQEDGNRMILHPCPGASNFGDWVDVAAPGKLIISTFPNHEHNMSPDVYNYAYGTGTSMACPHVAGLAGLLWASPYGTNNVSVRDRIESTGDPTGSKCVVAECTNWGGNHAKTAYTVYRITNRSGNPEAGTVTTGQTNTPDPPSLAPTWGAKDTLWFALGIYPSMDASSYPTNYGDEREDYLVDDVEPDLRYFRVASARRELNAESENPGTFRISGFGRWIANTIAIEPDSGFPIVADVLGYGRNVYHPQHPIKLFDDFETGDLLLVLFAYKAEDPPHPPPLSFQENWTELLADDVGGLGGFKAWYRVATGSGDNTLLWNYGLIDAYAALLREWEKILYTTEPPTTGAWNQVKRETGTGWMKLSFE